MADKIIIDGVDVSGCKFCEIDIIKNNIELCCKILRLHGEFNIKCNQYPNCHFKQLKRKEEECEHYKLANSHSLKGDMWIDAPTVIEAEHREKLN